MFKYLSYIYELFQGTVNRKLYFRDRRHIARNIPCIRILPICHTQYIVWVLQNNMLILFQIVSDRNDYCNAQYDIILILNSLQ